MWQWVLFAGGRRVLVTDFRGTALNGLFVLIMLRPLDLVPLTDFTYKYHGTTLYQYPWVMGMPIPVGIMSQSSVPHWDFSSRTGSAVTPEATPQINHHIVVA